MPSAPPRWVVQPTICPTHAQCTSKVGSPANNMSHSCPVHLQGGYPSHQYVPLMPSAPSRWVSQPSICPTHAQCTFKVGIPAINMSHSCPVHLQGGYPSHQYVPLMPSAPSRWVSQPSICPTHAQCTSKEMENHVCVGTCFSYTVPQTEPETPGDELLDYCDSCQASNFHWSTIQLDCEEYGNAYQVTKKLQMIANCSCSPCNPSRSQQPPTDNEVTYPSNDHHVRELLFKMLPDGHKFKEGVNKPPDVNRELQYTEMSLDILKKKLHTENKEQSLRDQVLLKYPTSFADIEEEEDINNLSY
ncbi:uncharacterized protein [Cherax quadricarinatus]|uniref:uncharacterized protein isoform X1 n=1 Tax=Cherax quadricarinatus TaxID=27406 RepID=UPI00387EB848